MMPLAILVMRASVMACKFALTIFVGRYLDLTALGLYGLAVGAVAIGPVVIGMGMVHVIMRDAVVLPLAELTRHLRHYWAFTLGVYAALAGVVLLASMLFGASSLWLLIVAVMFFEHFGNDIFQLFSNLDRPLPANITAFLRGAAWILLYIPLAYLDESFRNLPALFLFWLGGSAVAMGMFFFLARAWPWRSVLSARRGIAWIVNTIRNSILIYISDLSFVASLYIDRYLVTLFLGLELAGVYFLYWSVANAASNLVSMTVLQLQRPRLIKAHYTGEQQHRDLCGSFLRTTGWITISLSMITGLAFHLLLPLFKQPFVSEHLAAFWLIMAGLAMRSMADAGAMALFTAHRDRIMTLTNVIAVIGLSAAEMMLLPVLGLYGAGSAILVTFSAVTAWRCWLIFMPDQSLTRSSRA